MKEKLINLIGEENVLINEPLKNYTTFKIGGPADYIAMPKNKEQVAALIKFLKEENINYIILGNGSNVLASDEGYRGVIVHTEGLSELSVDGTLIKAGAGVMLKGIANLALENSLKGFEELSGIPGTSGGAIYMNGGAYGREIKDVLKEVTYLDDKGNIVTKGISELEMAYRKTTFTGKGYVILEAVLCLEKGNKEEIKEKIAEVTNKRVTKQPLKYPSAGSTFKRPAGDFAGRLIEESGLKGYSVGGAQVSELHAGFVINTGGATCKDVIELTDYVKKVVNEKFGIMLELEVVIL